MKIFQEFSYKKNIILIYSCFQISDDIISKEYSYPLELENEDNSFSASYVPNHFKSIVLNKENKNEILLNNDLLKLKKSEIRENLSQDKIIENSICK